MGHVDLGHKRSDLWSQLWISCMDCFTILRDERDQEIHGNYINGFSERNLNVFRAIW